MARAGYSAGDGVNYFELPQSGNQAAMLDLENSTNGTQSGLWSFKVRSGVPQIEVSIRDAQQLEGDGPGTTTMNFDVYLSVPSTGVVWIPTSMKSRNCLPAQRNARQRNHEHGGRWGNPPLTFPIAFAIRVQRPTGPFDARA